MHMHSKDCPSPPSISQFGTVPFTFRPLPVFFLTFNFTFDLLPPPLSFMFFAHLLPLPFTFDFSLLHLTVTFYVITFTFYQYLLHLPFYLYLVTFYLPPFSVLPGLVTFTFCLYYTFTCHHSPFTILPLLVTLFMVTFNCGLFT